MSNLSDWTFFPEGLLNQTAQLVSKYIQLNLLLGTAESCTGGLLGGLITSIPDSSKIYHEGIVCYSNQSKTDCLMVMSDTLSQYGAVSAQTAQQMVEGLLKKSTLDIVIGITGIAGPGGGTTSKPVGLVYISCKNKHNQYYVTKSFQFMHHNRNYVRLATLQEAIKILQEAVV